MDTRRILEISPKFIPPKIFSPKFMAPKLMVNNVRGNTLIYDVGMRKNQHDQKLSHGKLSEPNFMWDFAGIMPYEAGKELRTLLFLEGYLFLRLLIMLLDNVNV